MPTTNGNVRRQTYAAVGGFVLLVVLAVARLFAGYDSVAYDTQHNKDEVQRLWTVLSVVQADNARLRDEMTKTQDTLIKVETQFCNQSNIVNLYHANELRIEATLFHKAFNEIMPTDNATYPKLGSCE